MKEILDKISNPFDKEGFKRLIDLYLQSNHWYDFYEKIVSFYKDKDNQNVEMISKDDKDDLEIETSIKNFSLYARNGMWPWCQVHYFDDGREGNHRLYINTSSLGVTRDIVEKFHEECESQNLPYLLKYYDMNNNERNDSIVISVRYSELCKKYIDILRKIALENPDLIKKCGTPPLLTGSIDGWIGIADENTRNGILKAGNGSYNASRVYAIDAAIKKFLIKYPELGNQVRGVEELNKIVDNISQNTTDKEVRISEEIYKRYYGEESVNFEINRNDLQNLFQNNPNAIDEIFKLFQFECELRGFDINNPIFNVNYEEKLLKQYEEPEKRKNNIDFSSESFEQIIDFSYENFDKFNMEEKIKLFKKIYTLQINNLLLKGCIYNDIYFLYENGKIDEEFLSTELYENLSYISERFDNALEYGRCGGVMFEKIKPIPSIEDMLQSCTTEKEKNAIINARIKQINLFFEEDTPISFETLKKCDELMEKSGEYTFKYQLCFLSSLSEDINNHSKFKSSYRVISELVNDTLEEIDLPKIPAKGIQRFNNILFEQLNFNNRQQKRIIPIKVFESALSVTSLDKANEAKSLENSELNLEDIKKGETIDD